MGAMTMMVESNAFPDGGVVPLKNSMYGANLLPDFKISGVPATAQSVAIIFHDLDVAAGSNPDDNLHWMAWNIPVTNGAVVIEEGKLPDGATGSGMRGPAYAGPGAPNNPRYHHYVFEFYALNSKLDIPADTRDRNVVLNAMKGKVVGKHSYVGRFRNDTGATMGGGAPRGPGAGGPPGGGAGGPPRGPGGPPPGAAPGGF
jgi:Raf kinase inhibitor-like YbhB/YbcL family protein